MNPEGGLDENDYPGEKAYIIEQAEARASLANETYYDPTIGEAKEYVAMSETDKIKFWSSLAMRNDMTEFLMSLGVTVEELLDMSEEDLLVLIKSKKEECFKAERTLEAWAIQSSFGSAGVSGQGSEGEGSKGGTSAEFQQHWADVKSAMAEKAKISLRTISGVDWGVPPSSEDRQAGAAGQLAAVEAAEKGTHPSLGGGGHHKKHRRRKSKRRKSKRRKSKRKSTRRKSTRRKTKKRKSRRKR